MIECVYSYHSGDSMTRRHRKLFFIKMNSAPIYWMSKKQKGLETSSFGSEFIAVKQFCEYISGINYKLKMMGIPVDDPTFIFSNKKSLLSSSSVPDSALSKKLNSITCHFVRKGSASD